MKSQVLLFATLSIVLATVAVFGQVVTASLEGTVQDPSGGVIAAAKVQVVNTSTNVLAHTQTDSAGRFIFTSLAPGGPYTLTAEAAGFKKEERAGINLEVNQAAQVDVPLQVGSATETVKVTADTMLLETTTAAMGSVINNRSIVNLPLNQRNAYSFVFLVPGVTGTVGYQFNSQNMSINGGKPGSTNVLVDGIPSSPPLVNPIQGFATFPSVESVQEFKVQTNSYSAEFGRSGSGIVNLIYKSGTNQYHGSAYEFLRNSDLDSNSFFANLRGVPLASFKRSQYGGSLGGPVDVPKLYRGQNKTFFFFAYEGLRQGTAATVTTTVPTALQRLGDYSKTLNAAGQQVVIYDPLTTVASGSAFVRQAFPGNAIPADRINPVAANIIKYYPLPNQPGAVNSGVNNYYGSGVSILNSDTYDAKVDENINDRNRFFARYSLRDLRAPANILFPAADVIAEGGNSAPQFSNSAAADYTYTVSPSFLVEIRYGFARMAIDQIPLSYGFNPTTLGFPAYIAANADHFLFPGIAPQNYYTLGDAGQGVFKRTAFESHLIGAGATKAQSSHVIKFGWEGRLLRVNDTESGASTGTFSFTNAITQGPNPNAATATAGNAIASMLLGVGSGNMAIHSKDAATESKYYGAYFQDDWKVSRKLTLNLGVRYDLDIPRTERYNRMETFDPSAPSPLASQTGLTGLTGGLIYSGVNGNSRRQFSPQWTNFGPRFGFAYQAEANTVIRGGYGIFYAPSFRQAGATIGNQGFSSVTNYVGSPNGLTPALYFSDPFPVGLNPVLGSSQGLLSGLGSTFETPITGDNKVPYTENWDLDVQRQLPGDILVDASYVGSRGVHMNLGGENDYNLNQLTPQALALGTKLQQSVPNPFYGIITTGPESSATIPQSYLLAPYPQFTAVQASYLTGGYTIYHAFQLRVEKRFGDGLSVLFSFTGQKLIDNYSIISNVGNNTGGIQNIYNGRGERSISSNDISKHAITSGVYSLPFGRGQQFGAHWNRAVDAMLGGWQLNGVATDQTGFPLSPTTQNTSNAGGNVLRPNNNGQSAALSGSVAARLNGYLNASVFSQPVPFTFGNASRTLPNVRAPGTVNIDFSMFKNFHPLERLTAQFRAEAFNLLNQVVFGAPNMVLSSGQFGVISSQSNAPRQLQFALKLLF
jgi:hypothetical protein